MIYIAVQSKVSKNGLYLKNVAILKEYGHGYKLTVHSALRRKGYELKKDKVLRCSINKVKLENSLSRSKSKVFEYADCNDWDYFVNLTLSPTKYNRYDLAGYIKDLSQWIRNKNRYANTKLKYLFIPEHHKDGAWHIHGLLSGVDVSEIADFIPDIHPQKLIDAGYKNWLPYSEKFGYVSLGVIKNKTAVSKYMTKYIAKDMAKRNKDLNAHLFYASKGLKIAKEIKRGFLSCELKNPDYENDYVSVKWFDSIDDIHDLFYEFPDVLESFLSPSEFQKVNAIFTI